MSNLLQESPPLSPDDERLVRLYVELGRSSDALPYTDDFRELVGRLRAAGDPRSEQDILRRLFQLRKSARLPRLGSRALELPGVPQSDVELAQMLIRRYLGATGSRDQLPYSPLFEELLHEYNQGATRPLDQHQLWRLIARVSK